VNDRPRILAELARAVVDTGAGEPLSLRLCRRFVEMSGADGGAITLAYTRPERVTVCVTDATADRLEDLQEVLGEGPGPDAYRSGHAVTGTLAGDQTERWPMFAKAARSAVGSVAIHAFPMRSGTDVFGVLTVYQTDPRTMPHGAGDAQFLADAVGAAIARDSGSRGDLDSENWDVRDRIHQAIGMVVAQLAVGPDDALALLRAYAFSQDITLEHVATEVIERRRDFSQNADAQGDETS
jgi:hypothetical protein